MVDRVYIVFCLFILMFCRCADDAPFENEQTPKEGILIKLTNGSLTSTKTALSSSANLHHVKEVHAFLYQGDTTDMTKAKYVLHENLNWNPMDSADYKVDAVQVKEFLLENSLNLPSGNYTLLCVGLDDRSGETYGLPDALKNKPLSEAKATLAKGISIDGIAHSELFAGWETFEYVRGGLSKVEIEMRRRVAGVLCYLKDIPYTLTDKGTYRVTRIRLRLFADPNSSVSLLRPKEKGAPDFGTEPLLGRDTILTSLDLTGYGRQGDKNLYAIPVPEGESPKRLENTILMGTYLLPIRNEKAAVDSTLVVDVLGKITNSVNDAPAEGAEEVVLKSFPAVQEEATGGERLQYSIRPNVIYHIGQKSSDGDTNGDYPESLAGTKLNLKVTGWERDSVDVEFPGVPINPTIALVNESGGVYDTEQYIFDCMGTNTIRLRVYPSILKDPWKVTVIDEGSNMLFFQKPEEIYDKEYKSTADTRTLIPLVLTDYVKQGGPEIRKVTIRIVSLDTAGIEKEGTVQTLVARQYNAIIVGTGDKARGFSRFNWGTKRSITTGRVTADNSTSDWGYFSSPPSQIFGKGLDNSVSDNGYTNYLEAVGGGSYDKGFAGSAIQKGSQYKYTYDDVSGKIVKKEAGWYLPAKDELKDFLNDQKILDNKELYHIKDAYWSSNVTIAHYYNSRAYIWNAKNNRYEEEGKKRGGNNFYLRSACGVN